MYVCMYVVGCVYLVAEIPLNVFLGSFLSEIAQSFQVKKVKMVVRSDDSLLLSVVDTYYHIQIHFDSLSMLSNNRHSPASHRSGGIATGGLSWQNFLQGDCLHIYVYIHT